MKNVNIGHRARKWKNLRKQQGKSQSFLHIISSENEEGLLDIGLIKMQCS